MAEKLNQKETMDFKEFLMSEVIQSEALINLQYKKGIISKQALELKAGSNVLLEPVLIL